MDASFGTTPLAMEKAIRLIERGHHPLRGYPDPEQVITHRFPLSQIEQAVEVMASGQKNKVIVNP